jgi:hypothetical protein
MIGNPHCVLTVVVRPSVNGNVPAAVKRVLHFFRADSVSCSMSLPEEADVRVKNVGTNHEMGSTARGVVGVQKVKQRRRRRGGSIVK